MLIETINTDYIAAMKARDTLRSSTLSFLRAQIKNVLIDKREETLDDVEVIAIIKKQIKQRQDSIEQFEKGNRMELAEKEKKEWAILKGYLPEELSEEELKNIVAETLQELNATGMKDMGNVMKTLAGKVAGRADNKLMSIMVRDMLSNL